ncbi:MAG: T9SS type A sorting domain-containing protein, partial [Chitinophagales bacterium]
GIYVGEKQDGMYDIEKIQFTGFLAQDVDAAAKKINYDFSGVDKSGELMGLRYSSFVVPIVKSIQELDAEDENLATKNVSQDNEIEQLKSENAELEKRISKLEKLITKQGIVLSDETTAQEISKTQITLQSDAEVASLSQNIPNPFTGKTNINYFVPLTSTSAQIKIANANGQSLFLADVKLGSGVLEIEASQLAAGNYSYTLIVDGRVVDTKLMVIQK